MKEGESSDLSNNVIDCVIEGSPRNTALNLHEAIDYRKTKSKFFKFFMVKNDIILNQHPIGRANYSTKSLIGLKADLLRFLSSVELGGGDCYPHKRQLKPSTH